MDDNVCAKCKEKFKRKSKGWKRHSCSLIFEGMPGFFCDICFYALSKKDAGKKHHVMSTPGKSPKPKKVKFGTPAKKQGIHAVSKPSSTTTSNLTRHKYAVAVTSLLQRKGFCRANVLSFSNILRKEVGCYMSKKDGMLRQTLTLESLHTFDWSSCLEELRVYMPTVTSFLTSMLTCRHGSVSKVGTSSLNLTIGLLLAIILHVNSRQNFNFLQNMLALELYRHGAPQKLLTTFNQMHISASKDSARRMVDRLMQEYKGKIEEKKDDLQRLLAKGHINPPRPKRQLFGGKVPSAKPKGYTFCWDNTQIEVRARHQLKEKNVSQMLWALCYSASNRVPTEYLDDTPPTLAALDLPLEVFLPDTAHNSTLRDWLLFGIKQALVLALPAFSSCRIPTYIAHDHTDEMSEKSEIINLGVVDENPSTTDGAIGICEYLTTHVPTYPDGRPYTVITHCDGGAFERMVGARRVRASDRGPLRQLLGLEPCAQEFHKRGLMLQLIMDRYFKGGSQMDRGTLFNVKVVLNQHSVKKKVMDCFNHVEDMFEMTCDGLVCLSAMNILGMEKYDEELPFAKSREEKDRLLEETSARILDLIWLHPTDDSVREVVEDVVFPTSRFDTICCGQDVEGDVLTCSNSMCPSGGHFHAQCVEVITGESTSQEDDWWCSPDCEPFSKFCKCRRYIADSTMVECHMRNACHHGKWFHLTCVGLSRAPRKRETWHCPGCTSKDQDDSVLQYTIGLTWMLLNDKIRRHAIRTGNGRMMLEFWKDDGLHFWNEGHNKYLILMHRMISGINGWLSKRQAADMTWNRTVNIRGGPCHNIAMDKCNEFLNNEFKENLKKTNGKYTSQTISRSSYLIGSVTKDLDKTFAQNVANCQVQEASRGKSKLKTAVLAFLEEYQADNLFGKVKGRAHSQFPNFNASDYHQVIQKPAKLKARLLSYSRKLDRGRFAAARPLD